MILSDWSSSSANTYLFLSADHWFSLSMIHVSWSSSSAVTHFLLSVDHCYSLPMINIVLQVMILPLCQLFFWSSLTGSWWSSPSASCSSDHHSLPVDDPLLPLCQLIFWSSLTASWWSSLSASCSSDHHSLPVDASCSSFYDQFSPSSHDHWQSSIWSSSGISVRWRSYLTISLSPYGNASL